MAHCGFGHHCDHIYKKQVTIVAFQHHGNGCIGNNVIDMMTCMCTWL